MQLVSLSLYLLNNFVSLSPFLSFILLLSFPSSFWEIFSTSPPIFKFFQKNLSFHNYIHPIALFLFLNCTFFKESSSSSTNSYLYEIINQRIFVWFWFDGICELFFLFLFIVLLWVLLPHLCFHQIHFYTVSFLVCVSCWRLFPMLCDL